MKNEPDYTITISRRYIEGKNSLNVERTIINAQDCEVIFHSLHEISSESEKESPVAHLEKHLGLYPPENEIQCRCNRCCNFSEDFYFSRYLLRNGWIHRFLKIFKFKF